MKSRISTLLAILTLGSTIASADTNTYRFAARDPGVKRWLSYEVLGVVNHPFPILYVSTERFELDRPEYLVVLPPAQFDAVTAFTQARLKAGRCLSEEPIGYDIDTVDIKGRDETRTSHCIVPPSLVCDYFLGLRGLSDVHWSAEDLQSLQMMADEVRCVPDGAKAK